MGVRVCVRVDISFSRVTGDSLCGSPIPRWRILMYTCDLACVTNNVNDQGDYLECARAL